MSVLGRVRDVIEGVRAGIAWGRVFTTAARAVKDGQRGGQ